MPPQFFLEIGFFNCGTNLKAKLEIWLQKTMLLRTPLSWPALLRRWQRREEGVTKQRQHIAVAARRYQLVQYDRRQALLGTVGHRDFGVILSGWDSQWTIPLYVYRYYRHTYKFSHLIEGGGLGPLCPSGYATAVQCTHIGKSAMLRYFTWST